MKLPMLHVGFGTQCGPATFFPVWADAPGIRDLVTGSEASLSAVELPTPTVNRLSVTNHGATAALLTEGELLEGGQQHRLVARDVLVGAGETLEVDTLCVEQGRWSGSREHRHGGRRAPFHIQAGLHAGTGSNGGSRQGEVWQRVQRYEGLRTRSSTASLLEHLDAPAPTGRLDLPNLIDGQRGVIVGFGGHVLSMELFGSHELLRSHYRPMMESMVLDLQLFGGASSTPVTAQGARDLVVAIGTNGLKPVGRTEHGSGGTSRSTWCLEGRHPMLSVTGIGIGDGATSQIAHLSAWNTRHSMLASA
ncbi:DUF6569 family protein [Arthrobacter sp. E3]|uniref:ARPP-1 family domain-containing protein n=1 Tax=Arthrobacter sp. E3 TaxID=517402 RepID=UPI001A948ECD|nr:DUF6569 family protein [Arthrobacter sp. E3]